nr:Uncharacterised protein [Klebsiella pneumoniae]
MKDNSVQTCVTRKEIGAWRAENTPSTFYRRAFR